MTFTPLIELKLRITVVVIYVAVDVESGKISLISGRSSTLSQQFKKPTVFLHKVAVFNCDVDF